MASQHVLDRSPRARRNGGERGNALAAAVDHDSLTAMLDGVEHLRKPASDFRCTELSHRIRLSDQAPIDRGRCRRRSTRAPADTDVTSAAAPVSHPPPEESASNRSMTLAAPWSAGSMKAA